VFWVVDGKYVQSYLSRESRVYNGSVGKFLLGCQDRDYWLYSILSSQSCCFLGYKIIVELSVGFPGCNVKSELGISGSFWAVLLNYSLRFLIYIVIIIVYGF